MAFVSLPDGAMEAGHSTFNLMSFVIHNVIIYFIIQLYHYLT